MHIQDVKVGDYLRLKEGGKVYIRGHYNYVRKMYMLTNVGDMSHEIYRLGEQKCYTGFPD